MKSIYSLFFFVSLLALSTITCQANNSNKVVNPTYNYTNATSYKVNGPIQPTPFGLRIPLTANSNVSHYGNLISDLLVDVDYETTERLHIKIYDKEHNQVEVPNSPLGLERSHSINHPTRRGNNYDFQYDDSPFRFQVIRKSNAEVVFDMQDYSFIFEDQYIEISSHLPHHSSIYGLGESMHPFKRTDGITTLFNCDEGHGHYGSHPFYIDLRNGSAHGVFLLNAHGMDVIMKSDCITFKVIGGVLDFYFFLPQNAKPNSVVQAYTTLVGKPMMPAEWMLGLQYYPYHNVSEMRKALEHYRKLEIPIKAFWLDITDKKKNFMIDQDRFTVDELTAFSKELHEKGYKLIGSVDPIIPIQKDNNAYIQGVNASAFIKQSQGMMDYVAETYIGQAVFPDWFNPNTTEYWDKQIMEYMNLLKLDGLFSSMNEPSLGLKDTDLLYVNHTSLLDGTNETLNKLLYPGYKIHHGPGDLSTNTVSMAAQHYNNQNHYDLHNLYGLAQSYITRNSIIKYNSTVRPLLLTRSTFSGSGQYAGHFTGDNQATWSFLESSISSILNMQMFGIPFTGADICNESNDDEELCIRWLQLGAFYPFARIHTSHHLFKENSTLAQVARDSMSIRYRLLPYFYTLFEESSRLGTGVWRPLIFEFPHLSELAANDKQFMIGTDILVSPVTKKNGIIVEAQFPSNTIWYDYYDFIIHNSSVQSIDAPLTHIPLHIRGGAILLLASHQSYHLIIALDKNAQATGRLYIDDGVSLHVNNKSNINFIYTGEALTVNGQFAYDAQPICNITILGHVNDLHHATLNQSAFPITKLEEYTYTIINASIPLDKGFVMNFV